MTDEYLITALRMRAESDLCHVAADRLEALVKELAVGNELGRAFEEDAGQQRARAERLEAALREAALAWQAFKGATVSANNFAAVERVDAALEGDSK